MLPFYINDYIKFITKAKTIRGRSCALPPPSLFFASVPGTQAIHTFVLIFSFLFFQKLNMEFNYTI